MSRPNLDPDIYEPAHPQDDHNPAGSVAAPVLVALMAFILAVALALLSGCGGEDPAAQDGGPGALVCECDPDPTPACEWRLLWVCPCECDTDCPTAPLSCIEP